MAILKQNHLRDTKLAVQALADLLEQEPQRVTDLAHLNNAYRSIWAYLDPLIAEYDNTLFGGEHRKHRPEKSIKALTADIKEILNRIENAPVSNKV